MSDETTYPTANAKRCNLDVDLRADESGIRLDEVGRGAQALGVEIDQENPRGSPSPGQPHVQAADRTGPEHHDAIAKFY